MAGQGQDKDGYSADEGWLRLECGCVAVGGVHIGVGKWLKRRRASECGRSPSVGGARA